MERHAAASPAISERTCSGDISADSRLREGHVRLHAEDLLDCPRERAVRTRAQESLEQDRRGAEIGTVSGRQD
ncbi:hypothetical protein MUP01_05655 [Candidatus Bathyarchaeota archaeon]|nr:hypothetical protein [Candidatus Bathyarchaeota archaeon]